MRIACPSCNATYEVPDEQVTVGRVVRCARCGAEWSPLVAPREERNEALPDPAPETASDLAPAGLIPTLISAPDPVPIPLPAPAPPLPAPPPPAPRRRFPALALAWVVSLVVVAGILAGLVVRRDDVMRQWPPSARAYVALGLAARP